MTRPPDARTPPWRKGGSSRYRGEDIGLIDRNADGRPTRVWTVSEVEPYSAHPDELLVIDTRDWLRRNLDPELLDLTPAYGRRGKWGRLDWNAAARGAPGSPYDSKGRPRFSLEDGR